MGVPTWAAGQVLTASDVNTWFVPLAKYKASDTPRNSVTALAADPDLTVSVAASAVYDVDLVLVYTGASAAGFFQWDFDVPASATFQYLQIYQNSAGNAAVESQAAGTSSAWANTTGVGNFMAMTIKGTLIVSTTPGTFDLKWAQHASGGTNTTLRTGSKMTLQRIA